MEIPGNFERGLDDFDENENLGPAAEGGLSTDHSPGDNFIANIPKPGETLGIPQIPGQPEPGMTPLELAKLRAREFETKRLAEIEARQAALTIKRKKERQFSMDSLRDNLCDHLYRISDKQRLNGFPVVNGRINIKDYEGKSQYEGDTINNDLRKLDNAREDRSNKKDEEASGEVFERAAYVAFNEAFPGASFVRSAEVDDESMNNDRFDAMLFIGGRVACAFDFTLTTDQGKLDKKIEKVRKQNSRGGVKIEYCCQINDGKAGLGPEHGVPIINIFGDSDQLENMLVELKKESDPSGTAEAAGTAKKTMMYNMIAQIYRSIDSLMPDEIARKGKLGAKFDNGGIYIERLEGMKKLLDDNYPRWEVEEYLREAEKKAKKGTKMVPITKPKPRVV